MTNLLTSILFSLFISTLLTGQVVTDDEQNNILKLKKTELDLVNRNVIKSKNEFLSGKLYVPEGNKYNHPFFLDYFWQKGKIIYKALEYPVEGIKFDIESNTLIYLHNTGKEAFPVALNSKFIREFYVNNRHFVYIQNIKDDISAEGKPGYYELVYSGKTKFYIKWKKNESTNSSTRVKEYSTHKILIFFEEGKYHTIRNEIQLTKKLIKYNSEMKAYVKQNNLTINRSDYSDIIKVLEYYDSKE